MPRKMHSRTQIIENALGVKLPSDYALWLESEGYYDGEYYEVFGYLESFENVEDYPCVIGTTKRYRDHPLLTSDDLMIHFDEFLNTLVVINCQDGCVYNVDFSYREKIAENFSAWFAKLKELERKASEP